MELGVLRYIQDRHLAVVARNRNNPLSILLDLLRGSRLHCIRGEVTCTNHYSSYIIRNARLYITWNAYPQYRTEYLMLQSLHFQCDSKVLMKAIKYPDVSKCESYIIYSKNWTYLYTRIAGLLMSICLMPSEQDSPVIHILNELYPINDADFIYICYSMFLILFKSVTWFFHDCCGLSLLLLPCGVHW